MSARWSNVGRAVTGGALVLAMVLATAPAAAVSPAPRVPGGAGDGVADPGVAPYKGKLVDEAGKPISGVFPMTFKLYAGLKAKKPTWSETMWVAVDRGVYVVHLGVAKPLPSRSDLDKMVLGVDIKGVGELVREPFVPANAHSPVMSAGAPRAAPPPGSPLLPGRPGTSSATGSAKYADTAGYAVEADHAKNSDRLMNLTVDDIVRKAAEEGGGAAAGGRGAGGGAAARLGGGKRYGNRVGGPGGTGEYSESCPKGYVMTGIRGGAGNFVDSIQIICSPIE